MDKTSNSGSFFEAAYVLANGLFMAILSARSDDDCRLLADAANKLSDILCAIHEDLPLELIHLAGFMEEKLGELSYTTPKPAVDGQIELGTTTIQGMLGK